MLRADALSFAYSRTPILDGVSLEVAEGELVGVIGPNGAGKSTFLRCLYGALRPASGKVRLGDRALSDLSRREIARWIGVVPQQCSPVFPVSVEHFVGLGRFAHRAPLERATPTDRAAVSTALSQMGLERHAARGIDELSGGEFRRLLIAQALAQEPRILLFDEPIQQLDLRHQLEIMEFARRFAHRPGCAAVIVLHDLELAARYCDALALMEAGRVVSRGAPDAVLVEANLERVFGVRVALQRHAASNSLQIIPLAPIPSPHYSRGVVDVG